MRGDLKFQTQEALRKRSWPRLMWSYVLLFIFTFLSENISVSLSQDVNESASPSPCQVTIHKCSDSDHDHVTQEAFTPPQNLKSAQFNKGGEIESEIGQECEKLFKEKVFEFRLKTTELSCSHTLSNVIKRIEIDIGVQNRENNNSVVIDGNEETNLAENSSVSFTHQGNLQQGGLTLKPRDYCISRYNAVNLTIKVCAPGSGITGISNESITIRKCCPQGKILALDINNFVGPNWECIKIENNKTWEPYLYKKDSKGKLAPIQNPQNVLDNLVLVNSPPKCNSYGFKTPHSKATGYQREQIRVSDTGTVYTRQSGNHKWVNWTSRDKNMCVDGFQEQPSTQDFTQSEDNQILIYCAEPKVNQSDYEYVHTTIMAMCTIFLSIVVIVYVLIWNDQNIHGWTVATYSFFMLCYLVSLIIENSRRIRSKTETDFAFNIGTKSCAALGVFVHFFFISIFSWMAVINLDLFLTIGSIFPIKGREAENSRFVFYTIFALGVPFIVVSISVFMELHFDLFDDTVLRPLYGFSRCSLDRTAVGYYADIMIMLLFASSIFISCFTLKFLIVHIRQGKLRRGTRKQRRTNNMAILLCKVFILLAFSWVFEIAGIFWFLCSRRSRWFIVMFDIHNFIQSVGFFGIFVCKREITELLRKKYKIFEGTFSWFEKKFNITHEKVCTKADVGVRSSRASADLTSDSVSNVPDFSQLKIDLNQASK